LLPLYAWSMKLQGLLFMYDLSKNQEEIT
jgi:hypothetical protein